ncbi:hypothetical protein [Streptomyces mexicanus]|uniref:hypothetical protein n=1 Tax=Streptomyces mexicanus TaxID=178566 RepID=UPI0031EAC941
MATRAVRRRARAVLGQDPLALVWCELHRGIPRPPKDVHRAAGKGRLRPGHHWLVYVACVVFCFVVLPWMLVDTLLDRWAGTARPRTGRSGSGPARADRDRAAGPAVFDGDWNLTAGRLLLRWYTDSPSAKRLVLLTADEVCLAASPRRRAAPTKADDFRIVARFAAHEAWVEGEAGQPRGFAVFRLCFADGSWLEAGRLAGPDDADHFLRTVPDPA